MRLFKSSRPPLGVMPRWLYTEKFFDDPTSLSRLQELEQAIRRYEEAGLKALTEWQQERHELNQIINQA